MNRAILPALGSALLFGASTPLAKLLVGPVHPVLLAGLLYAGCGLGLLAWLAVKTTLVPGCTRSRLTARDLPAITGAIFLGGVVGPILLMTGLAHTPATTASLLLNLESLFTALLAWFAFGEHFDRRIAFGMALIVAGGVLLAWQGGGEGPGWPALAIGGACLAWALDNNLTRKVSGTDPVQMAALKGTIAGTVNLVLAGSLGFAWPAPAVVAAAGLVGLVGYGVSLVLFIVALRELGTARTGAYFSTAPFIGAAVAVVVLRERPNESFWIAGALMGAGVWLHVAERHEHGHVHAPQVHDHPHVHDEHHRHAHAFPWDGVEPHAHRHAHERLAHRHPHYPDLHHRHGHSNTA
jgi:drug/metabolite transporter (DMT)-like permease